MKRSLQTLAFAMLSVTTLASAKDLATINGKGLTEEQYKEALSQLGPQGDMVKSNPEVRKQFLEHIIESTLLANEGKNQDLDDSDKYKALLETAKRDILARLYLEKYIADNSGEAKLREYFEKNKAKFTEKEVKAQHILFAEKDKALAEKTLKEINSKNNFDDNFKKYATEKNGSKGGDLNWFKQGRMVPEFEKAAFGTEKGKVYNQLIKTQFGFHILKVLEVRGGDGVKFEDKKQEVEQEIRMNARPELVKSLREKAQVKVDTDLLGKMQL